VIRPKKFISLFLVAVRPYCYQKKLCVQISSWTPRTIGVFSVCFQCFSGTKLFATSLFAFLSVPAALLGTKATRAIQCVTSSCKCNLTQNVMKYGIKNKNKLNHPALIFPVDFRPFATVYKLLSFI